jgi:DNA invertase Pin-like site-specific DNA recombinase
MYADRASGAKERRPGLDALMADARQGRFDAVVVFRFDRFARSVRHAIWWGASACDENRQ